jgi:hypothetical protein
LGCGGVPHPTRRNTPSTRSPVSPRPTPRWSSTLSIDRGGGAIASKKRAPLDESAFQKKKQNTYRSTRSNSIANAVGPIVNSATSATSADAAHVVDRIRYNLSKANDARTFSALYKVASGQVCFLLALARGLRFHQIFTSVWGRGRQS